MGNDDVGLVLIAQAVALLLCHPSRVVYHAWRIICICFFVFFFLSLLCFRRRQCWEQEGKEVEGSCSGTGANLQLKCILLSFFINSRIIVYLFVFFSLCFCIVFALFFAEDIRTFSPIKGNCVTGRKVQSGVNG